MKKVFLTVILTIFLGIVSQAIWHMMFYVISDSINAFDWPSEQKGIYMFFSCITWSLSFAWSYFIIMEK